MHSPKFKLLLGGVVFAAGLGSASSLLAQAEAVSPVQIANGSIDILGGGIVTDAATFEFYNNADSTIETGLQAVDDAIASGMAGGYGILSSTALFDSTRATWIGVGVLNTGLGYEGTWRGVPLSTGPVSGYTDPILITYTNYGDTTLDGPNSNYFSPAPPLGLVTSVTFPGYPVPEPTTISLLAAALLGLGGFLFVRRRHSATA